MSTMFKAPKVAQATPVKEVDITAPQARGRTGRTILAGATSTQEDKYKKKSILGG
jgi:hypothetical protein